MYAIGFVNNGNLVMQCGNNGLQRLCNKTTHGWYKELVPFLRANDIVFIVADFTQKKKMCEMNNSKLFEYCQRNHVAVLLSVSG